VLKRQFFEGCNAIDSFNQAEKGGMEEYRPEVILSYGDINIDDNIEAPIE